jgi:hypothetical protein
MERRLWGRDWGENVVLEKSVHKILYINYRAEILSVIVWYDGKRQIRQTYKLHGIVYVEL